MFVSLITATKIHVFLLTGLKLKKLQFKNCSWQD